MKKRKNKNFSSKSFLHLYTLCVLFLGIICLIITFYPQKDLSVKDKKITKTMTYTGEMKNHTFQGKGKLVVKDIGTYEGNFDNGRFSGKGKFTDTNKWVYSANFIPKKNSSNVTVDVEGKSAWQKIKGEWKEKK